MLGADVFYGQLASLDAGGGSCWLRRESPQSAPCTLELVHLTLIRTSNSEVI